MPPIKAMNSEQLQYLLDGLSGPYEQRDRAMLTLAANTGLRVSELIGLNHGDVIHAGAVVEVLKVRAETAKRGRSREIPLNDRAREAVGALVEFNREQGHPTDADAPLLVSRRGNRLSKRTVQHIVKEARGELEWATPHKLRHGFATRVLKASGNIRTTQELLGHRNLATTQIYTHVTLADMKQAVNSI